MKELIFINIGGAGCKLGTAIWELFLKEHNIKKNGELASPDALTLGLSSVFEEKKNPGKNEGSQFVPRAIFSDLDDEFFNWEMRKSNMYSLFNPNNIILGKETTGGQFARAYYTIGREIIDRVIDKFRKTTEKCDNLDGYVISHSIGGGTGSGFSALLLERLSVEFPDATSNASVAIYPSKKFSNSPIELFNFANFLPHLNDLKPLSLVFDNEALYSICNSFLEIESPSFNNLNALVAEVVSSVTAGYRFESAINLTLRDILDNNSEGKKFLH